MNYKLLGENIRKYRRKKKYTLEQLAEILDVSATFVGQIERAQGIPSLATLVKIADALEVSADSLLFDNLNEKTNESYFIKRVLELTESFSTNEKELLLKNIEVFAKLKESISESE